MYCLLSLSHKNKTKPPKIFNPPSIVGSTCLTVASTCNMQTCSRIFQARLLCVLVFNLIQSNQTPRDLTCCCMHEICSCRWLAAIGVVNSTEDWQPHHPCTGTSGDFLCRYMLNFCIGRHQQLNSRKKEMLPELDVTQMRCSFKLSWVSKSSISNFWLDNIWYRLKIVWFFVFIF